MNKIEIGTIITVAIAIIGGAVYLGKLQGELTGLKDAVKPGAIREATEKSLEEISLKEGEVIKNIESHVPDIRKAIEDIGEINTILGDLEGRKLSDIEFWKGCKEYGGNQYCDDRTRRVPPACPEDCVLALRHGFTWNEGRCGGERVCGTCVRLSR